MALEVVLLIGLPGSGKSTFFRERFERTHLHVSKDNFRKHRRPVKRQEREIRAALEEGRSVVVDNTNVSNEERSAVIRLARDFGAKVVGYVFEFDVAGCHERNQHREGAACVPLVAIHSAAKRYREPRWAEGFDELWRVRLTDPGFAVESLGAADEPE